ncbi:LutC/YkgG family protein [Chryseosolibacter indicus]|uniref:LUD domain-containing protein n=1 Tax=Chryseosolibacter indicus TaxID=2782351 RepID=A0ABS5VJU7_9BACT|nr:LUD domain-containing protein [Chryseosolibacter indicus]MBT1701698.1 LUD domain-containing protein [Chryseosolibacter indicus]
MTSRDRILQTVKKNQPVYTEGPSEIKHTEPANALEKFKNVLVSIGGAVLEIQSLGEVKQFIEKTFPNVQHIISSVSQLPYTKVLQQSVVSPHDFKHIQIAILEGKFGVAENGAVWLTENAMLDRALPFICENLILIVPAIKIVPTLHEAYYLTDAEQYNFGTFIAGPSKTADIEQSLVLGAHGPKSLTVFLLH